METARAHITARSEKEAMDWSLVLASQGIETFIERSPEDGVWRLHIPPAEFDRAQSSLRQYRLENRARAWQQEIRWTGLLFDWRAGLIAVGAALYGLLVAHIASGIYFGLRWLL